MYTSEVFRVGGETFMRHFRESTRSSGLFTMTEIAQSVANPILADMLGNPDRSCGHQAHALPTEPADRLHAPDLRSLVQSGSEVWTSLLPRLGGMTLPIQVIFEQRSKPEQTLHGLYVPPEYLPEPKTSDFVATPDEMDALINMADRANDALTQPGEDLPGHYL